MAESILVTGKRISDMELVASVTGREKIPTGTASDEAVTPDILTDYVVAKGKVIQRPEFDAFKQDVEGQLDTIVGNASASNQSIREALAREVEDRIAGDSDLQTALDAEVSARITADNLKVDLATTIQAFITPEAGVDPVTGVADGAYFNVRSSSDESYADEYRNVGGSAVATGKSYPSSNAKWYASQIVDESGQTQQEINAVSRSVVNVVELRNLSGVKNGDTVRTLGHTKIGLGGGTYTFEALSSKTGNNGSYIASSVASGTWVLISDNLYFEHFGVINDGTDQSAKIQACLDYAQSVNIKNIQFEKSNEYAISDKVWVKPQPLAGATTQQPQVKTIIKFNGAVLRLLSDNQIGVEVSREYVRLENPSFITTKTGCVGIFNGLSYETEDTVPDATIRRSSQFMEVIAPCGQGLDVGIKFKPAKRQGSNVWGAYYHRIYDHSFNSVNIAFYFDASFDNLNATTRTRIFGGSHLRGACTFYCLNAETIEVFGYSSEIITRTDARLPNSEACVIYFPRTSTNSGMANGFSKFYGDIENCTNYYDIEAYRVEIDGRFMSATSSNPAKYDSQSWRNGGLRRTNLASEAISAEKGKSAQLKLSRTSNPTDEGGVKAELLMGEKADGSGFEIRGSGDITDNHFDINFPKLTEPAHNELRSNAGSRAFYNFGATQGLRLTFGGIMRVHEANNKAFDVGDLRFSDINSYVAPQRKGDGVVALGLPDYKFSVVYSKQLVLQPPVSANPTNIGEMVFELTSDTQLKIKVRGSDGVVRSAILTLS